MVHNDHPWTTPIAAAKKHLLAKELIHFFALQDLRHRLERKQGGCFWFLRPELMAIKKRINVKHGFGIAERIFRHDNIYVYGLRCWHGSCQVRIDHPLGINQHPHRKNVLAILQWVGSPWFKNGGGITRLIDPPHTHKIPHKISLCFSLSSTSSHAGWISCFSWKLMNPCCPQLFPPCCSLLSLSQHSCSLTLITKILQ